jgi:alkylation response protein AidB-like acyl-CoA dehydrogenase
MGYIEQAESLAHHIAISPFSDDLARAGAVQLGADEVEAILDHAARFAASELDSLGQALDRNGATVEDGRVRTSAQHHAGWQAFRDAGWLTLALPDPHGQNLPMAVVVACEELFNRASAAFYMLPTATRCGAALLLECAPDELASEWVPMLASGEWTATICISEPDAGSDVGRIRTRATEAGDHWRVTGEKCWISFGDHDLSERIGHLMLARTSAEPGVRGLSLFLVPSTLANGARNGVHTRRIEEKLGLHGSPTCVLGFEDAEAFLVGSPGKGLQQMFHMMLQMRLGCGAQGTGLAAAAFDTALGYAGDRKQGGLPDKPPVALIEHADVQRQLLEMAAAVELSRALNIACAQVVELARMAPDNNVEWTALAQFLLPIVKDGAAWAAVNVSSQAIQVLGGAGFTLEWPVERLLRDARIFPIFEGTTGIQAQDMVHRRIWRDKRAGLNNFLQLGKAEAALAGEDSALARTLDILETTTDQVDELRHRSRAADAGSVAFLELCKLSAYGWLAQRIARLSGSGTAAQRMRAAAGFFLTGLEPRARLASTLATSGEQPLAHFAQLMAN